MSEAVLLTIIIPAYNEEKNIGGTLEEIAGYLAERKIPCEVIIVDDGSTDGTSDSACARSSLFNNFRILKNDTNRGKGYSVKKGALDASGEYLLFMDADNSTSVYEFDKFLPFLKEGYDVVIASRRLKDSIVEEPQPLLRAKMGQFYIFLAKIILRLRVSDFNCGFKAYNVRSALGVFKLQRMDDWSFDVELLFLVNKYKLKIKEVPVRWVHKAGSKVRPVRDAIKSFISVLKIRINDAKRLYQ